MIRKHQYWGSWLKGVARRIAYRIPVLQDVLRTTGTAAPISWRGLFVQKVLGFNREASWPMHPTSHVSNPRRVHLGIGAAPGLSRGCYIQSRNGIEIGDYTLVAPNVGLLSASHDPYSIGEHKRGGPIRIGRYCWIGMNAVILPEVTLGDHTVVGAGAVVTHSFPEGYCVVGGVPARLIRKLDPGRITEQRNRFEYIGFRFLGAGTKREVFRDLGLEKL